MYICIYIHMYIYAYINVHIFIYVYAYIYTICARRGEEASSISSPSRLATRAHVPTSRRSIRWVSTAARSGCGARKASLSKCLHPFSGPTPRAEAMFKAKSASEAPQMRRNSTSLFPRANTASTSAAAASPAPSAVSPSLSSPPVLSHVPSPTMFPCAPAATPAVERTDEEGGAGHSSQRTASGSAEQKSL